MQRYDLTDADATLLRQARTAVLATIRADGSPRLVPICYAVLPDGRIYSPLDQKPKRITDPLALARVRDILARPQVGFLVHRWSEDWTQLAWLRLDGEASLVEPGGGDHASAVDALRARYPQYADQDLERRPLIAIEIRRVAHWSA